MMDRKMEKERIEGGVDERKGKKGINIDGRDPRGKKEGEDR